MSHKFKVGQCVRQLGTSHAGNKSIIEGLFEVVLSAGVEYSLIVGIENSLVGALA